MKLIKLTDRQYDLIRQCLYYAQQDRIAFLDCWKHAPNEIAAKLARKEIEKISELREWVKDHTVSEKDLPCPAK